MMPKKRILILIFLAGFTFSYAQNRSTSPEELIKTGVSFYGEGRFSEAVTILQLAGPVPEALYWLSLAELASGSYNEALSTLDKLGKIDSAGQWSADLPYHRGRCLYYLGRNEEALIILGNYAEKLDNSNPRKSAAYYWVGECLFAMGRLDDAAGAFSMVMDKFPYSIKYEASSYRINLIIQKKVEEELLTILKWSHEESLRSLGEYQEREKSYDQAIIAYQQRISELLAETGTVEAATAENAVVTDTYRSRLVAAERRIAALEASLAEANAALAKVNGAGAPEFQHYSNTERSLRVLELQAAILELSDALNKKLNEGGR